MKEALSIGGRIEPFVDDFLLDSIDSLEFKLTAPERRETALEMDRPWEQCGSGVYNCAFYWRGAYHLYYRASCGSSGLDTDPNQYTCYARSSDGVHWEKPSLGLVEFNGSTDNNIVLQGRDSHNFVVFPDSNPACAPDAPLKGMAGYVPEGLYMFYSEDGLHFKRLCDTPAVTSGLFDSQNVAVYDPSRQLYRIYSRCFVNEQLESVTDLSTYIKGVRYIQNCASKDLIHWDEPRPNLYGPEAPLEHLYTNATTLCPGAEHIYMAFPMRFMPERKRVESAPWIGVSDCVFMTSRDGVNWDRRFLDSWIRPDIDERNWTQRNFIVAQGILDLADGFSSYVGEHYSWPDCRIARYSVRKHGYASLYAGAREGRFTSKPLIFEGGALSVNYATAAPGEVRFALCDPESGEPFPGFSMEDCAPMYGNAIWESARFAGGSLASLSGRPVIVKSRMRLANLYAMRFSAE